MSLPGMSQADFLLTIPEAAQRMKLGRSTRYLLIKAGELPVIRIGRSVRVDPRDINRWIERNRVPVGMA